MGKVIRLDDESEKMLAQIRQLFAKVKFYQEFPLSDKEIINKALFKYLWLLEEND